MDFTVIPDSLCDYMHKCLGGQLKASPDDNPCGHRRDSHFTITPESPVENDVISEKLTDYYRGVGAQVEVCTGFCFEITLKDATQLWVSVSNYSDGGSGRIIFTVEVVR